MLNYFFPQKCNKGTNSTPLLHAINFGLFIRLTDKCISVTNLEEHKTTIFVWDALTWVISVYQIALQLGSSIEHNSSLPLILFFLVKRPICLFWLCKVLVFTYGIFFVVACGIHSSDQGSNSGPPCVGSVESEPLGHQGSLCPQF